MEYRDGLAGWIKAAFADEVAAQGGTVTDAYDDGARLFARAVLARGADVGPGDRVRGGVAVKAAGGEVCVHPYVFRLVCRNGAITARVTGTRHLTGLDACDPDAAAAVREAVRACCAGDAFAEAAAGMRTARERQAELGLAVLPLLSRFPGRGAGVLRAVMDQFFGGDDRSRFGLMNAVTAVARDEADPEVRWGLEEFGGGIACGGPTGPGPRGPLAGALRDEAVGVG